MKYEPTVSTILECQKTKN